MARWTHLAYASLVAVAATNREMSAVLLVLAFVGLRPREWRWALLYAVIGAGSYGAVRLAVGDLPNTYTPAAVLDNNLHGWALQNLAVYGGGLLPLLAAGLLGWRKAQRDLKRLTLVVCLVYLPLWAVMAAWQETRLLMPLLILLLPMVTRQKTS